MEFYIIIYLLGVLTTYAVIKFKAGFETSTLNSKIIAVEKKNDAKLADLEKMVLSNVSTVGNCNVKCTSIQSQIEAISKECDTLGFENDEMQVFCDKLKKEIVETNDRVSKLRPVIRVQSPLPVQVIEQPKKSLGRGVEAVMKK